MKESFRKSTHLLFLCICLVAFAACSEKKLSIYDGLGPEDDGSLAVDIPDDALTDIDDDVADEIDDELDNKVTLNSQKINICK